MATSLHMTFSPADHDVRVARPWALSERSGRVILMLLVPTILVLDYTGGREFSLHLFYLIPTGLAAWSFGSRAGYAVGLAAAAYWAFVGFATRHPGAGAGSLAWDVAATLALFLFFAFVVARHRSFVDQLVETARLDMASGALSRREFGRLFETEVKRARRYARPLALVLFDVASAREWAKLGEKVLPALVRAGQGQIRDSDSVGRVGDRRLGIILVECPANEAFRVAARIREGLAPVLKMESGGPAVGLVSFAGASPVTAVELLKSAEAQLANAQADSGLSEERLA